jgi:hypothetical protein
MTTPVHALTRRLSASTSAVAIAGVALLGACSSGTTPQATSEAEPTASATSTPAAPATPAPTGEETAIEVHVGDTVLSGRLWGTAAGQALADQLPLTLTFSDLSEAEKIGHLPQALPMDGLPEGDDPVPGDIGFYEPWGNLVFYYGDVGYWDGIARIGTFDSDLTILANQSEDFEATIQLAD